MASVAPKTTTHISKLLSVPTASSQPRTISEKKGTTTTSPPKVFPSPTTGYISQSGPGQTDDFLSLEQDAQAIGIAIEQLGKTTPPPPSPLDHFEKWFPESTKEETKRPEFPEKRQIRVNKLLPQPPYHVFDRWKKRQIVLLVTCAGVLSPLSTSIFFPALPAISTGFAISSTSVMLVVMAYMIVQAIASLFWMPLCSVFGRRPIFMATLLIFVASNVGLIFARNFAVLLIWRTVQSFGTAALTAICAAIIGDISIGKERCRFIGVFGSILVFTFISPVIGGLLTYYLGFRAIFWFLLASGTVVLTLVVLMLPETLRSIAGNGTIKVSRIQQPLIYAVKSSRDASYDPDANGHIGVLRILTLKSFAEPLHCLLQMEVVITAIFGSVVFAICSTIIATTSLMFHEKYQLSHMVIGLTFLPAGAGSVLSFFTIGYLVDHDFCVTEQKYRRMHQLETGISLDYKTLPDFPIERARLRNMWWIVLIFIAATAGYGFSFTFAPKLIALPLVLQFFIASSATAILLTNGILIADLYTGTASVTAAVNFMRFLVGALAVGLTEPALVRFGSGITFVILAAATMVLTPIMVVQWMFGKPWRAKRNSTWPRERLVRLPGYQSPFQNVRVPDIKLAVFNFKNRSGGN